MKEKNQKKENIDTNKSDNQNAKKKLKESLSAKDSRQCLKHRTPKE